MGTMITIPLEKYDSLVEAQARVNVLTDLLNRDNSMNIHDIYFILGKDEPGKNNVSADYDAKIKEL